MDDLRDCRVIRGDVGVVISRDTAREALRAMREKAAAGGYKNLMADDASFISASIAELNLAANQDGSPKPSDERLRKPSQGGSL